VSLRNPDEGRTLLLVHLAKHRRRTGSETRFDPLHEFGVIRLLRAGVLREEDAADEEEEKLDESDQGDNASSVHFNSFLCL
jgi:hypothetical protein